MAELIFSHKPNTLTQVLAPGDTAWHQVSYPAGVLQNILGAQVLLKTANGAGTGDGSLFYIDCNKTTTPTVGFPVSGGGQVIAISAKSTLWYKLTAATDQLFFLYEW